MGALAFVLVVGPAPRLAPHPRPEGRPRFVSVRRVAGDEALVVSLVERLDASWQGEERRRLAALDAMVQERQARAGEVSFLLEPDLKEGGGGLRDLTALVAARRRRRGR